MNKVKQFTSLARLLVSVAEQMKCKIASVRNCWNGFPLCKNLSWVAMPLLLELTLQEVRQPKQHYWKKIFVSLTRVIMWESHIHKTMPLDWGLQTKGCIWVSGVFIFFSVVILNCSLRTVHCLWVTMSRMDILIINERRIKTYLPIQELELLFQKETWDVGFLHIPQWSLSQCNFGVI